MSSPAVQSADRAVGSMSRLLTAAETPAVNTADKNLVTCAQDKTMATDSESIGNQPSDVAEGHTGNGAAPGSYASPTKPSEFTLNRTTPSSTSGTHDINHIEAKNPDLDDSKSVIASNGKPDMEHTCTTVASTRPVGIYYPPRRPNIFRARAKHLRFPDFDQRPVASDAVSTSEGAMEDDGEDFSLEDMEEFQSEAKQNMEKKTKRFMRTVQQYAWRSRVEDLGTVQEIEE